MEPQPQRRPGDLILDRCCPDLTPAEREEARERLKRFAEVALSVAQLRQARRLHERSSGTVDADAPNR